MPTEEKSSVHEGDHCKTVQNRENLGLKKKKNVYLSREKLHDTGFGNDFLDMTPKQRQQK